MAVYREDTECDADQWESAEPFTGPEEKAVYNYRAIDITAGGTTDQQRGWVCTFANTGLVGLADYYDPVTLGKPVVGNFIRPLRFDWKCDMKSDIREISTGSVFNNSVTFRLVFLLVWQFPSDIVLGATQWLDYYLDNPSGNRHQSFLYPDRKEKVVVLYDCNHTVASPPVPQPVYGNVVAAAGGQAGYIVGPADPGYVVPAATVNATSTSMVQSSVSYYGGHTSFLCGSFDLEGTEAALWRDPEQVEEEQIVPCIMCFVCCQDSFHYYNSAAQATVGNRPTTRWEFYTRYTFTDQ